jgi:phosphoribosylformimino-5-aminoimidazole carboxamide ribotide isomerase
VRGGKVVCSGWLEATGFTPAEALENLSSKGFTTFLVTDTERDGMMAGARVGLYKNLVGANYDIVAAGGITTTMDLKALADVGVTAAVVGKSLYEGGITIGNALAAAQGGK